MGRQPAGSGVNLGGLHVGVAHPLAGGSDRTLRDDGSLGWSGPMRPLLPAYSAPKDQCPPGLENWGAGQPPLGRFDSFAASLQCVWINASRCAKVVRATTSKCTARDLIRVRLAHGYLLSGPASCRAPSFARPVLNALRAPKGTLSLETIIHELGAWTAQAAHGEPTIRPANMLEVGCVAPRIRRCFRSNDGAGCGHVRSQRSK
jgi:hypothetical protein